MAIKKELEFLVACVQDFIALQPKSAQIALAEKAQVCVNAIEAVDIERDVLRSQLESIHAEAQKPVKATKAKQPQN